MTDLTKITTPFGLLDPETQEALKNCGGPWLLYSINGVWVHLCIISEWHMVNTYRQALQPVTYPKIPWELLPAEFDRAAVDGSGKGYAYGMEVMGRVWRNAMKRIDHLPGFDPGTCDWRDSLVERPK